MAYFIKFRLKLIAALTISYMIPSYASCKNTTELLPLSGMKDIPGQMICARTLKAIYEKMDVPVEVVLKSGRTALIESLTGRTIGEACRDKEVGERFSMLLRVPTPISYFEPRVFTKNFKDFRLKSLDSLDGYRIGRNKGVYIKAGIKDFSKVYYANSIEQLIKMLANDHVDFIIVSSFNGFVKLKELNLESVIIALDPPLPRRELYHYIHESRKNDLYPKVSRHLKKMSDSGELEKLRKFYINKYLDTVQDKP